MERLRSTIRQERGDYSSEDGQPQLQVLVGTQKVARRSRGADDDSRDLVRDAM